MKKEMTVKELDKIREKVDSFLNPLGYSARVEKSIGDVLYIIEPDTRKVGNNRKDFFDGMQIQAFSDGTIEVSEYMAGKNEDELYIYKETKSLTNALKDLIKGNKRKPIKKYADGGGVGKKINFKFKGQKYELDYHNGDSWSNDYMINFTTHEGRLGVRKYYGKTRNKTAKSSINNSAELSESELTKVVSETIKRLDQEVKSQYAKGGSVGSSFEYTIGGL